ncbi:L,D-transpeptidase Cds6 family protein [Variovorax sp. GB1P17]|uniref:L,D-transpeptidase Cds6 family protein n=1 Tax=Variovorax sp. GB1P17 TaxID=3443740 RepID=UPI003F481800
MNRFVTCLLAGGLLSTAAFAATPAATTTPPAAPATPAAATPAPPPAPAPAAAPAAAPNAGIAEVETAVRAWAAAWSARDVDRYLAAYAPDFTPARNQDRKRWEAERRTRITGKSKISVTIDDLVISVSGQTASARFKQVYRADKLNHTDRKTLELQRVGNQWLIRKESIGA